MIGVSPPFKLPKLELSVVKSVDPDMVTVISFSLNLGFPPLVVLFKTKVLFVAEPTPKLLKSVLFETEGEAEPFEIIFPFPDTLNVPWADNCELNKINRKNKKRLLFCGFLIGLNMFVRGFG